MLDLGSLGIYRISALVQANDGAGVGDLEGVTSRLEYLADLGVDATWLSAISGRQSPRFERRDGASPLQMVLNVSAEAQPLTAPRAIRLASTDRRARRG